MSPLGAETSSSSSSSSSASDPGKHRPVALKPDYFTKHPLTGEPIDFDRDFYLPFIKRYATAIRAVYAEDEASRATPIFILAGPIPNEDPPRIQTQEDADALGVGANFVYAPHWYDLPMLFSKSFNKMVGHNTQALARVGLCIARVSFYSINHHMNP